MTGVFFKLTDIDTDMSQFLDGASFAFGVIRPCHVEKNGRRVILIGDSSNFYVWSMTQALLYSGYECLSKSLELLLATENGSEFSCFADVDLENRPSIKERTRYSPLCVKSKKLVVFG